jgi:hypothetical protein
MSKSEAYFYVYISWGLRTGVALRKKEIDTYLRPQDAVFCITPEFFNL